MCTGITHQMDGNKHTQCRVNSSYFYCLSEVPKLKKSVSTPEYNHIQIACFASADNQKFILVPALPILNEDVTTRESLQYPPIYAVSQANMSATACQCFMHDQCKGAVGHPYIKCKVFVRVGDTRRKVCVHVHACMLVIGCESVFVGLSDFLVCW